MILKLFLCAPAQLSQIQSPQYLILCYFFKIWTEKLKIQYSTIGFKFQFNTRDSLFLTFTCAYIPLWFTVVSIHSVYLKKVNVE